MKITWMAAGVLLGVSAIGYAAPPPGIQEAKPEEKAPENLPDKPMHLGVPSKALLPTPPNSMMIGQSKVDEIRAFPEMSGGAPKELEKVVGMAAIDRVFESKSTYPDAVAFYDKQFNQKGYSTLARTVTPSSTAWTIRESSGPVAIAIVRNTSPTTVETVESAGAKEMVR